MDWTFDNSKALLSVSDRINPIKLQSGSLLLASMGAIHKRRPNHVCSPSS